MWGRSYPKCNDTLSTSKQSPINIVTSDAKYNASLQVPIFQNYDKVYNTSKLKTFNTGHSVEVKPIYKSPQDAKASVMYKGIFFHIFVFS